MYIDKSLSMCIEIKRLFLIEDYQAQGKPLPEPLTANVSFRFV
ncbi:MAG: hypothetical protein V7K40_30840 [Nostoc sp.]